MAGPSLLIDGRNCAYRAIYANKDQKCHSLVVMLRFIVSWIVKHRPLSVNVFWDAPRQTVWRRQILSEYKNREAPKLDSNRDIREELALTQAAAQELFGSINIRQYQRNTQEADDLIYAACRVIHPDDAVIVSSDGDFIQIPYFMPNVKVYEPRFGKWASRPICNPIIQKALMGDVSDCIDGYAGIGKVKSTAIASDRYKLQKFLDENDRKMYLQNLMLIDLSLNPDLLANQTYVSRQLTKPLIYNKDEVIKLIGKYKLEGLLYEFDKVIVPFSKLPHVDVVTANT